jgi:hypothetical protein
MFIFLITAAIVVITLVIVWLSVAFKSVNRRSDVSFSWEKGIKYRKK